MKTSNLVIVVVIVILAVVGIYYYQQISNNKPVGNSSAQLQQNSQSQQTNQTSPDQIVPEVGIGSKTGIGSFLTDTNGMTLYYFANDMLGKSNCNGTCASIWPAFYSPNMNVGSGLNSADFSVITRTDGGSQTTYHGWPLYYYSNDSKTGDTNGQGFNGIWFVAASPFYTLLLENNSSAGIYISDSSGRSLYMFANDNPEAATANPISNCTGVCSQNWLPYYAETGKIIIPAALNISDFTEFTRSDGKSQLAYKRYPIYYYSKDAAPGNISGNGLSGLWFLARPQGFVASKNPTQTPAPVQYQAPAPTSSQYQAPSTGGSNTGGGYYY